MKKALLYLLSCLLLFTLLGPDFLLTAQAEPQNEEYRDPSYPDEYYDPIQTNEIEGWPQGPSIYGKSAVLMDADTGAILYSKNQEEKLYPASITKIMTCLLALENSRLTDRVVFSDNAIWGIERDSSHIGIRIGEVLSMEECLYGLMLESANEVSIAIAEHIAGSTEAFADMMNARAAELGCKNTHFVTPNGLHDDEHYTCTYDMALISQAAYANETFRKIIGTKVYKIGMTNRCGEVRWLNQHHKMLQDTSYHYDGCTGGKTGFTDQALNTLVTFAEKDGLKLICVIMKTIGRQIYPDTASLLNYGFSNFVHTDISLVTADFALLQDELFILGAPIPIPWNTLTTQATVPSSESSSDVRQAGSFEDGNYYKRAYWHDQIVSDSHISTETSLQKLLTPVDKSSEAPTVVLEPETIFDTPAPASAAAASTNTLTSMKYPVLVALAMAALILLLIIIRLLTRPRNRKKSKRQH